jgi:hypothetical protein
MIPSPYLTKSGSPSIGTASSRALWVSGFSSLPPHTALAQVFRSETFEIIAPDPPDGAALKAVASSNFPLERS